MSERNSVRIMKSSSEGEILERQECGQVGDGSQHGEARQFKRTFTLPRNPFSGSRRRARHKAEEGAGAESKAAVFRRPSWRRFFSRVLQRVPWQGKPASGAEPVESRVPPPGGVPGVTGLRNHGNTCFMNAVLQCLGHTDVLAEYFVLERYKLDLTRRNRLRAKKHGTRGEVTEQLALLLKAMWTCQYEPQVSSHFKLLVDKYGSQYRGNSQHDAQEFLLWLLDKVHEDLNTATKNNYKAIKNTFGRPDEVVAAETMANHVRCNNSFVHAVFQAQFRSSLTCPRCHRQSNTFDPFLCMSVPVPQNHRRPLYVTVLYTSQQPRQVKIGVSIQVHAEIRELREALASDTGISESHMLLTEVDDLGFHRTFSDWQPVSLVREEDPLYCLELPQLKEVSQDSGAYILLCWVNVLVLDDHRARFSCPYTMQVCRETSYEDLQKLILKEMNTILHDDVLVNSQDIPLFRMRVVYGIDTYLDPTLDHPLYMEAVEQTLALCEDAAGPQHLKLLLEWDLQAKESTIADDSDQMEEHASVKQLKATSEQGGAVTLEECFELYTRAEVLGADDAWHCPSCNRKQEVVKKLGLWSLPDILVIHLKRFRQSKQRASTKLTTLVEFPLTGFDMSPHLASKLVGQGSLGGWSPWKRPCRTPPRSSDYIYDLYAVCNHHGHDLQGGHYTAYCRNPYDAQWYSFDDTRVEPVAENSVVTAAAYMLFYQRHGLSGGYSTSSAASTSSSGSGTDHWVNRMPAICYSVLDACVPPRPSRSHEQLSTTTTTTNNNNNADDGQKQFARGGLTYSTLQPAKRSVATETDAAELDHHSDDEALPASRHWESPVLTCDAAAESNLPASVSPVITESRV